MKSITTRWVRGSLFFTIAVLLIAEALFLFFTVNSYYDGARREVESQINTILNQLSPTATASLSADGKAMLLRRTVEEYEDKARFELMLVNASGWVVSTSSGVTPRQTAVASDVLAVLDATGGGANPYMGTNENGEKVLAITRLIPFSADGVVAVRVVTSLEGVDGAIRNLVIISIVLILVVVGASIISGVYFIRSIVLPLQKVEATATHIAAGDFDTRIENSSSDEIGRLCKTINNMAEELGRSEKMKNDFISSVSHELRTPLTSIKGWIETVGNVSDPADPTMRRGVEIISSEADRLYDMVEELLDFSRMQGGLQLSAELLDLAAEVEEAVLQQVQRARMAEVSISYEAPEIPIPVMADKNRVRQVFLNVLDNAIKYSNSHDTIEVEILLSPSDAYVVVTDKGQGIAPEDLENVKLRFYKGKGSVRGSGIGLAVVDEIMAAHDGGLELTSEPGKGTSVSLRFPLYVRSNEASQVSAGEGV